MKFKVFLEYCTIINCQVLSILDSTLYNMNYSTVDPRLTESLIWINIGQLLSTTTIKTAYT